MGSSIKIALEDLQIKRIAAYPGGVRRDADFGRIMTNGEWEAWFDAAIGVVPDVATWKSHNVISMGAQGHSLFLADRGHVYSCGNNTNGNLGREVATASATVTNLDVTPGLENEQDVAAGNRHSLFLADDGRVYSCGYNSYGNLGRAGVYGGTATAANLDVIPGLENVQKIAACGDHSLFLTDDGHVYSCGYNYYGNLGRAVATASATVTNLDVIPGLENIQQITAGANQSYFVTDSGQVYSCGDNSYSKLGYVGSAGSATNPRLTAIPESTLADVRQVASTYDFALFLTGSGRVYACGLNSSGQLGYAVASGSASKSNLGVIPDLGGVRQIAAGNTHSLFLTRNGRVYSCGSNNYGQLGRVVENGSTSVVNIDVIPGLSNVKHIAATGDASLFVTAEGQVYSCGRNNYGQLGRVVADGSPTVVNLGQLVINLAA